MLMPVLVDVYGSVFGLLIFHWRTIYISYLLFTPLTAKMVPCHNIGFFDDITSRFGRKNTVLLKSWIDAKLKFISSFHQRTFLLRCRKNDILPSHIYKLNFGINFRSNRVGHRARLLKGRFQRKLLNLEINDINCDLTFLSSRIDILERTINAELPLRIFDTFFNYNMNKILSHGRNVKLRLTKKFDTLMRQQNPLYDFFYSNFSKGEHNNWIVNVSGRQIPDNVLNFLSLGDRFALPFDFNNKNDRLNVVADVIKNFELNSCIMSDNVVSETRSAIARTLHNFLGTEKHVNCIDRYILGVFKKCNMFLKRNNDVFVTRADKGQLTVVMNKSTYINQMKTLLDDTNTYKKLNKDPIKLLSSKINGLVRSWRDMDIIDEYRYKQLICTNGNLPRCYGLPKIHKNGFPLRIIVSTIGSPLYNIACYLHDILDQSIKKPKSFIKDSWTLVRHIRDMHVGDNDILISLDVVSLFTNIPKDLVTKGIEKRWCDISKKTKLSLPQFLYAIDLILCSTSFVFDGLVYEQIFGSPMGSPLSPILANIVMDDLETHCLELLAFNVKTFYRYVDDILTIIPKSEISNMLHVFNSYHPRLQFTHETESSGKINFLDISIIRESDKLITNWYRKPTFSGRYINFFSSHPFKYKMSVVRSLVDRALLLSDTRFHKSNINIIKEILYNNCFPPDVINKYINIRINELESSKDLICHKTFSDGEKQAICIPYIRGLSHRLVHILNKAKFRILLTVPKKLSNIIKRGKDLLKKLKQTGVVYRIKCKDCECSYIGQTKRHLETRINEHKNDIRKHESNFSVVSLHRINENHNFEWTEPEILYREQHRRKREIVEMLFIKKHDNTVNLQKDTENLNSSYDPVIKII